MAEMRGWGGQQAFWCQTPFQEHRRADNFVVYTCFYAEDVEYSEAHLLWPG